MRDDVVMNEKWRTWGVCEWLGKASEWMRVKINEQKTSVSLWMNDWKIKWLWMKVKNVSKSEWMIVKSEWIMNGKWLGVKNELVMHDKNNTRLNE